ncbi:MAG: hypothetical protein WCF67_09790, partial [Chitinophagaceae bacterium]
RTLNTFELINFNQFKMQVKVSAKVSGDGAYQLAEVQGDNWYAAVPDKQCKLQWILMGPDKNKLKVKLMAAEMRGKGASVPYVGTKDWEAPKPKMRIDFCGNSADTVEAYTFQAENGQELWQLPPQGPTKMSAMNTVLTACFIDVQRTMEKAAFFKTPGNVEKMKQQMQQQYNEFIKNGGADMAKNASSINPQDMQKMMQMANAMGAGNKIGELVQSSNPGSYLFLPQVYNKQKIILKERLNGKEIFPENTATEYAWFHLSLEQDPDSPYHVTGLMGPKN